MAEEAEDLLLYGVAAAEAGSKDEARFYLEWVLRAEPYPEQEAKAWYWLSCITDQPAEKRACLENVLAIYPTYPEARRDLALLEGRLSRQDIAEARESDAPLVPSGGIDTLQTARYNCPRCGARMISDPSKEELTCQFCGYAGDVEQAPAVKEQDWVAAIYTRRGHIWELPTARTLHCANCGAGVTLGPSQMSIECPFCGTPYVEQTVEERELIRPDGMVPFSLDAQAALGYMRKCFSKHGLRQREMDEVISRVVPRAVYLPFWTFNLTADIEWTHTVMDREYGAARSRKERGSETMLFDSVLVAGTRSLPEEVSNSLTFDLAALRPYVDSRLSGWPAEIYSLSVADASLQAVSQATNQARSQIGTVSGADRHDKEWSLPRVEVLSYKLVLLPVWIGTWSHKGQGSKVVVSGQTGTSASFLT